MHETPHYLRPYLVEKVWGGERLRNLYKKGQGPLIGESWEISILNEGESTLTDGRVLSKAIPPDSLPYLVKLLDTNGNLSVQVHPDDHYAKANGLSLGQGKSECWVILEANHGAGLYLGFKEGVTYESLQKSLSNSEDISTLLHFHEVMRGDFFWVPAGSVHAIGAGVFLAEVQQNSGVTFRVWDWNRLDNDGNLRALHIKEAFEVLNFEEEFNKKLRSSGLKNVLDEGQVLIRHPQFEVLTLVLPKESKENVITGLKGRCVGLICLGGKAIINDHYVLETYQTLLLPSDGQSWRIKSLCDETVQILITR